MAQLRYKSFTLDSLTWTPIIAPINCDYVTLQNANGNGIAVKLRTASSDATTEKLLQDGVQEVLASPNGVVNRGRYGVGDTICYAQTASSTFDLQGSFLL